MVAKIKNGEFGQTQIGDPTILKNKISTITGTYLLDNGKNVIAALQAIEKELDEGAPPLSKMKEEDWPEWMDQQVFDILTVGWELEQVSYDDEDVTTRVAVQVLMGPSSRVACAVLGPVAQSGG
jgi:hypothetical protein